MIREKGESSSSGMNDVKAGVVGRIADGQCGWHGGNWWRSSGEWSIERKILLNTGLYVGLNTMTVFVEKCEGRLTNNQRKRFLIFASGQKRGSQCVEMERGVADGWGNHHVGKPVESFSYVKMHKNLVPG